MVILTNYLSHFQQHGIPSTTRYNYKYNLTWHSNQTDSISAQDLFLLASNTIEDLVKNIRIRTFEADEEGVFSIDVNISGSNPEFTEQRHRRFGRCFTLHPKEKVRKLGIYYIRVQL